MTMKVNELDLQEALRRSIAKVTLARDLFRDGDLEDLVEASVEGIYIVLDEIRSELEGIRRHMIEEKRGSGPTEVNP